jgi:hypothetical protein
MGAAIAPPVLGWLADADQGDEAYQNRYGGSVIARRGPHVLRTTVRLRPGTPAAIQNQVTIAVAGAVLAAIPEGVAPP